MKLACALPFLAFTVYFLSCGQPRKRPAVNLSIDYKKGESLYDVYNDSAFYFFNRSATNSTDSLEVAMAYSYMGIIQSRAGDYFGSQESLLQSLKHLDERKEAHVNCLLSDYNELGRVSLDMKNYDAAISYYDKALHFVDDANTMIIVLSNKAVGYQKMHQYTQAISIYDSILYKSKADQKRYARILSNMAYTKWLKDSTYRAAPELREAFDIQERKKDNWGLNASLAHLSAYYQTANPDSALFYASRMYTVAKQLSSPDDELEALQKLITLSAPGAVKTFFNRYHYLDDSLQTSRNEAKNQFALIRFEVARSKADNLTLQKENAEKKLQILIQWALIAVLTGLAVIIVLWLRKRRQRLLREQQLKTSQKVHDVVANGLYHLMARIQYESPDQELVLDDLEQLYEKSRNISYDQPDETLVNYHESIAALLASYSTDHTRVSILGNAETTWEDVPPEVKSQLFRVLQELMINMKKHSGAGNVVIRFERSGRQLNIRYGDDGRGLPAGFTYGNGLRNTENRISGIGGSISFDTSISTGLKIQLIIPFA
jgi:signal transduction histidine kinase